MSFRNLQIEPSSMPQSTQVEWRELDPKHAVTWAFLIGGLVTAAGTIVTFIVFRVGDVGVSPLLPTATLALIVPTLSALTYFSIKARRYAIREHDAAFAQGIWFRRQTFVPFNRIQHVEVSRGPIDRKIGLATLKFFTAGGSGADLSIPGLQIATAESLRERVVAVTDEPS